MLCKVFLAAVLLVGLVSLVVSQGDLNGFLIPNQGNDSQGGTAVDNSGTTTTTPSPAFRSCVSNCPTINNYNPVCGSNGVTYDNQYKLECARRCGLQVTVVRGGTCAPL